MHTSRSGRRALALATVLLAAAIPASAHATERLTGTLLVGHGDSPGDPTPDPTFVLEEPGGKQRVVKVAPTAKVIGKNVPAGEPQAEQLQAISGAQVALTTSGGTTPTATQVQSLTAAAPYAPPRGAQKVLVIMARFDAEQPIHATPEKVRSMIFTGPGSLKTYFEEASEGAMTLAGVQNASTGDVTPWVTLAGDPSQCSSQYTDWRSQAIVKARRSGFDFDADGYDKLVIVLDGATSCPGSGWVSSVGSDTAYAMNVKRQVIGHELGHAFGLYHAGRQVCTLSDVPVASQPGASCASGRDYEDTHDIMGNVGYRELNAVHKRMLGFLPAANVKTWTTADTAPITLTTAATSRPAGSAIQQIQIPLADGSTYFLEARRASGGAIDDYAATDPAARGVMVHRGSQVTAPETSTTNRLVRTSPMQMDWLSSGATNPEGAIQSGRSFYDPVNDLTIETTAVTATTATVRIQKGPKAGAAATITRSGGVLTITDAVGRANDLQIGAHSDNSEILIVDNAGPLTAPAGCTAVSPSFVRCPMSGTTSLNVQAGGGDDVVFVEGNIPAVISGGSGADQITGATRNDSLSGGDGNDAIVLQTGATLACGPGSDRVRDAEDRTVSAPADCETVGLAPRVFRVADSITVEGSRTAADQINVSESNSSVTVSNNLTMTAGAGCTQTTATSITCPGDLEDATVSTYGGNDVITATGSLLIYAHGGDGNDKITTGDRADVLYGGEGTDTVSYTGRTTPVRIDLNPVEGGSFGVGGAYRGREHDRLASIEVVLGSPQDDELLGSDAAERLDGGSGNDIIEGGKGADVLLGGPGADTIVANDGVGDIVDCGADTDKYRVDAADVRSLCETPLDETVSASGAVLSVRTHQLTEDDVTVSTTATGYAIVNATAPLSAGTGCTAISANRVECPKGTLTKAVISTFGRDDRIAVNAPLRTTIDAGSGSDVVQGGPLADYIVGGDDADRLIASAGGDTLSGSSGAGRDIVDYSAVAGPIKVVFDDEANDGVVGAVSGDNILGDIEGIIGTPGDDTFVSSHVSETFDGRGGSDTVSYERSTVTPIAFDANDSTEQVTGGGGTDSLTSIETIAGSPLGDTFVAGPQDERLLGMAGDDTFTGVHENGNDVIRGGAGADTVDYGSSTVGITASFDDVANDGVPGVETDDIGSDVEELRTTEGNDTVINSSKDQTIRAKGGRDTINFASIGGTLGVRIYLGTNALQSTSAGGNDTLADFENVTGTNNVDKIFGSDDANIINGRGGADIVDGRGGADALYMRDGGNDTITCGTGADELYADVLPLDAADGSCEDVSRY